MAPRIAANQRKPPWLRTSLGAQGKCCSTQRTVDAAGLFTVCQEALCPNRMECFGRGTATFLLLGPSCTRGCTFCAVDKSPVGAPDEMEPARVVHACQQLDLEFCVLTMVTRDDLPDGGADHVAQTIRLLRQRRPGMGVEVLVSDLGGDRHAAATVLDAQPEVFNHNVETVPRLYPSVRPQADYLRSLEMLRQAAERGGGGGGSVTKSGMMLGLGESRAEVLDTLGDLREAGCQLLTLGQYLAPSRAHHPVARYLPPEEFDYFLEQALAMGFGAVASAPLVRSSYQAQAMYERAVGGAGRAH